MPVDSKNRVTRLPPYHYLHVMDNNTNVAHIKVGPATFVRKDHEELVLPPTPMINIPPEHYCIVANPHCRNEDGSPVVRADIGLVKLRLGDSELRMSDKWAKPFPLYPGESLLVDVRRLHFIPEEQAVRVRAIRAFVDDQKAKREPGEEWLIRGPRTLIPRVELSKLGEVKSIIIGNNEALRLVATQNFTDAKGNERKTGDVWQETSIGAYLPDVWEKSLGKIKACVLTEQKALHLRALASFKDAYGIDRKAGDEWLVTHEHSQTHLPGVFEENLGYVGVTTLREGDFCVILNPVNDKLLPQWGHKKLVEGPRTFFLHPGEELQDDVKEVRILGEDQTLLVRCIETFTEGKTDRQPGEEWLIKGPCAYVPPKQVEVLLTRDRIPLDQNEGIYVRNKNTGAVYSVTGSSYMLEAHEELWNKQLDPAVEKLVSGSNGRRDAWRVVSYRVPHNTAVQMYNFQTHTSRVVFGPELVMLEPEEHFTVLSLTGGPPGEPKRANYETSLVLNLGPDSMSDSVIVETSDHARLMLRLSYKWLFKVDQKNDEHKAKIFSVRDFVGDACKNIASSVRGCVAARTFDDFHKNSADIIKRAVFGNNWTDDEPGELRFPNNNLVITNVDVQSVEPIEQDTKAALQESVQLAIEIQTKLKETLAKHDANREQQIADGLLERARIADEVKAEAAKKNLVELQCKTAALKRTGKARAQAIAKAEAARIKGEAEIQQASLKAKAAAIRANARLAQLKAKQAQEVKFKTEMDELEINRARTTAQIEAKKFADIVNAIGSDTIEQIARAGPEMQAKLLEGLGLEGYLVTDGASPINLFQQASSMIAPPAVHAPAPEKTPE